MNAPSEQVLRISALEDFKPAQIAVTRRLRENFPQSNANALA